LQSLSVLLIQNAVALQPDGIFGGEARKGYFVGVEGREHGDGSQKHPGNVMEVDIECVSGD
jgi:hypothetical protein